jgi:3-hydroxyisobutyrate dehydrogenase-like beta-hydroxyacid dehydrogenase
MRVVGILSPGAMGSAIGASLRAGGARVVTTVAGRSPRSAQFAQDAGIEVLPGIDEVVSAADLVLSVVPPDSALHVATALAAAAARTGRRPLVADLNAIAPATVADVHRALDGLDLVDGSISGPPPADGRSTSIYLSGPSYLELASLAAPGIEWRPVGDRIGAASAVKMCTASVYKGLSAILAHALLTAEQHGVTNHVLADLDKLLPDALRQPVQAATKAWRFVGEMEQIAVTQAGAGLTPALFDGVAEVYRELATSQWGGRQPEDVPAELDQAGALADLRPR